MKKILSFAFLLLALPVYLQAQISDGSEPPSFSQYVEKAIDNVAPLTTTEIPSLDMEMVKQEVALGNGTNYFARPVFVNFDLNNSGKWTELPSGDRLWRIKVKSTGALSLHALFDNFYLPKGGRLYAYNPQHTYVSGGYTEANNHSSREFAFSPILGDELIVEYYEPANVRGQGQIHIYRIEYAYKPVPPVETIDVNKPRRYFGFGTSELCHINVNCTQGDNWQTHKRSVVQMLMAYSDGTSACTGALMQNDQGKPYVLSAWHCQDVKVGVTALYNQWNFAFNWEAPTCSTPSSLPKNQTITGCSFKIANSISDYFLFELNTTPPANYNVYYAGWDRTGTLPTSVVGIHHPAADIKKISGATTGIESNPSSINIGGGNSPLTLGIGTAWIFDLTFGFSQGGSSGSPLFDQNGRIVGQLTGGSGSCAQGTFCIYGKMSTNWAGLQPFLSSTDASRQTMNGYDPNIASTNGGVTAITSTVSPCNLSNNVPVKFTVRNHGQSAQTNLPYSWTLTHPTAATQSGNGTVASLAGLTTTDITVNVDMSSTNTYTFTARTNITGDSNTGDDAKVTTFTNTTPTTSSSNITFAEPDAVFKMTINYTKGNGENRLVLLKEGSAFTDADLPVQGQSYTANITFGFGSKVGNAYVVYKGSAASAPILDGLTVGANYHVAIVEYSCSTPKYLLGSGIAYASKVYTANERDLLSEGVKVFPNPAQANKEIRVELSNIFDNNSTWELQNAQGKVLQKGVFEQRNEGLATRIALRKQSAGIYFVRIKSGNDMIVKKIAIQ